MKKIFLADLSKDIDYSFSERRLNYDELCLEFGTPEDICSGFDTRAGIEYLRRKEKMLKRLIFCASTALVIFVIACICIILESAGGVSVNYNFLVSKG